MKHVITLKRGVHLVTLMTNNIKLNIIGNFEKLPKSAQKELTTVISENLNSEISRFNAIDNRKLKLFEFVYQHQLKTVSEISTQIFWSSRQINRYFNSQFGIPLKEFLKIVRCNATYQEISNGNLKPQNDFFDQAHFIKEIKKYTGATPKELHKNKNDRFLQLSTREEK